MDPEQIKIEKAKLEANFRNGIAVSLAATGGFGGLGLLALFLHDDLLSEFTFGKWPSYPVVLTAAARLVIMALLIWQCMKMSNEYRAEAKQIIDDLAVKPDPSSPEAR